MPTCPTPSLVLLVPRSPHRTDGPDCLRPYRPLDAEGIVLHGSGTPRLTSPRVFGSFKSTGKFRQIGDRRGQNSYECRLEGVSRELPAGFLLTKLTVPSF